MRIYPGPTGRVTWCVVPGSPGITRYSIMVFPLHYWTIFGDVEVPCCEQRPLYCSFSFPSYLVLKLILLEGSYAMHSFTSLQRKRTLHSPLLPTRTHISQHSCMINLNISIKHFLKLLIVKYRKHQTFYIFISWIRNLV